MKWTIPASLYHIWTDFSLEVTRPLDLESGHCYHLKGGNGAGKSSFIKKVLLPLISKQPSKQYILYLEQQVQSQFDAVKAYAVMQKPAVRFSTLEDMFDYQLNLLSANLGKDPRPIIIILDETVYPDKLNSWLSKTGIKNVCLVYISHQDFIFLGFAKVKEITFNPISPHQSKIEL